MSTTPPSPNRDASASGAPAMRPLNVIAAVANGGVPQARIRRVLADVAGSLRALHAQGGVHGGIALSTIGLDTTGKAHLLTPPLAPSADAEDAARIHGYAAFEQYTDDPELPCGPWTDIYALSAVAHAMLTGQAPPSALDRCVKDTSVPLSGRDVGAYDAEFLQAVDRGLSMSPFARPDNIDAFSQTFGLGLVAPAVVPQPVAEPSQEPQAELASMPPSTEMPVPSAVSAVPASQQSPESMPEPMRETGAERTATEAETAVTEPEPAPAVAAAISGADVPPVVAAAAPPAGTKPGPRVPLLVLLGVLAAIALAVYMWLRPEGRFAALSDAEKVQANVEGTAAEQPEQPSIPTPPALSDLGRAEGGNQREAVLPSSPEASASDTSSGTGGLPEASPSADGGTASPAEQPATSSASATTPASEGEQPFGAETLAEGQTVPGTTEGPVDTSSAGAPSNVDPAAAGTSIAGNVLAPDAATTGVSAAIAAAAGATSEAANAQTDGTDAQAAKEPPAPTGQVAVSISVRPWGEVIVDGRSRGVSPPLRQLMLSPGRHQVTIRNPASADYQTSVTVRPGSASAISHTFE